MNTESRIELRNTCAIAQVQVGNFIHQVKKKKVKLSFFNRVRYTLLWQALDDVVRYCNAIRDHEAS